MTTLLLLGLTAIVSLLLNTLLLWGLAKLFHVERATILRAALAVVLLSVVGVGMLLALAPVYVTVAPPRAGAIISIRGWTSSVGRRPTRRPTRWLISVRSRS